MARRDDLIKQCEKLGVEANKSRRRVDKTTGEYYMESTVKDLEKAVQSYYLKKYKEENTLSPFMNKILTLDSPMLALQQKDKKLDSVRDSLWEDDNQWMFQEKIDGCFEYNTPIMLEDGRTLPIGYIVDNRIDCRILSYNEETKKIEPKRIINWFNNGYKSNLLKFRLNSTKGYYCTNNHKFYNNGEYVEAKENPLGSRLIRIQTSIKQMIMGTCLGDTNITYGNSCSKLRLCHGYKQKEYLEHKLNYIEIATRHSGISGYGAQTYSAVSKSKPEYKYIYDRLNNKHIDESYLDEMGIIGFTYWYLDDGSRSNYKDLPTLNSDLGLATMAFDLDTNIVISNWLTKKGYKNKVHKRLRNGKEQYSITVYRKDAARLFEKMAPYVPECMNYKLPEKFRFIPKIEIADLKEEEYHLIENVIIRFNEIHTVRKSLDDYRIMYDIEVEDNHNYFANGFLVHNCRCMVCYDLDFGWDMYSRNKSITDCLPISYKTKLLMPEIKTEVLSKYGIKSFIIDTELVPLQKQINAMANGVELVADTQLSLVTSILGSLDDLSHRMQETNPLKFIAFDLVMLNGQWLTDYPLLKRDKVLNGVINALKFAGMDIRLEKVQSTVVDKHKFYEHILSSDGEGVVAKDLNSKYDLLGKRAGEWIKIKRTVSQSLLMEKMGDTVDAFVSGFTEGTPGTTNAGLVGALEFSIYLTDDFDNLILDEKGNPVTHHIATVSGITSELRQVISTKDEYGRVALNPNFYGKVATIDGQDISSRNYRFAHATFQGWRPDRSIESCKMRKSFLERLVL